MGGVGAMGAVGGMGGMGGMAPMAPGAAEQAAQAAAGGGGGAGEPLLGVICPGRPMTCAWQITEATRAVMVDHITAANEVPDVLIALLPDRPFLSAEQAAIIYWTSDGANWSLLGAIAQQKPSAMLRTGWGTALEPGAVVQLAVSIEPMQVAANLGLDMLAAGVSIGARTAPPTPPTPVDADVAATFAAHHLRRHLRHRPTPTTPPPPRGTRSDGRSRGRSRAIFGIFSPHSAKR